MNDIVLIRHLDTDLGGTFCGHTDPDLNASGRFRLRALIDSVAHLGIRIIYSSDLRRASQTATAMGNNLGVKVQLRRGLREIYFGQWEGLCWEQVCQQDPQEAQLWVRQFPERCPPGGELYRDFTARIEADFHEAVADRRHWPRAIVSHRGVLQHLLTRFLGFPADEARKRTEHYGAIVIATPSNLAPVRFTTSKLDSAFARNREAM